MDFKSIEYLTLTGSIQVLISYLSFLGRSLEKIAYIESYLKAQGLFRDYSNPAQDPTFSDILELDLSTIVPALAGPKRPHDYVKLSDMKKDFLSVYLLVAFVLIEISAWKKKLVSKDLAFQKQIDKRKFLLNWKAKSMRLVTVLLLLLRSQVVQIQVIQVL